MRRKLAGEQFHLFPVASKRPASRKSGIQGDPEVNEPIERALAMTLASIEPALDDLLLICERHPLLILDRRPAQTSFSPTFGARRRPLTRSCSRPEILYRTDKAGSRSGEFDETAEHVCELQVFDGAAINLEQPRRARDVRKTLCPRDRDIQSVP
jgi:hypothetical protein